MKHYNIRVDKEEALRYLGYHGHQADGTVTKQLDEAVTLLEQIAVPAYIYKLFDLEPNDPVTTPEQKGIRSLHTHDTAFPAEAIRLKGTSIRLPGADAASFLKECRSCIIMAVTIGRRVDEVLHRRQITDMSGAVILDSCASTAVESICNQIEADLGNEFESRGLFLTDRFSPGYGDLPLNLQPAICRTLSTEKRIGLTITGGMLLTPTKSVTAFLGVSNRPQPKKLTGCARCHLKESCNYRKAGITCAE